MSGDSTSKASLGLDIATDHRIRRLFGPVEDPSRRRHSKHVSMIQKLASTLTKSGQWCVSQAETQVTMDLAGPAWTGGILAITLRPANSHPYHQGTAITIQDCETLSCLRESFQIASSGTLGFDGISLVDSLPFSPPDSDISIRLKSWLRNEVYAIIRAKRPRVVLCMWQDRYGVPLSMEGLKSLGVGRTFTSKEIDLGDGTIAMNMAGHRCRGLQRGGMRRWSSSCSRKALT